MNALIATQTQIDAINALLPTWLKVEGYEVAGVLYLGADLRDYCGEGDFFYPARGIIMTLEMVPWPS
ncbi:MAG: hypothetical protein ACO1SV_27710 [Fimbriimonas sp.]